MTLTDWLTAVGTVVTAIATVALVLMAWAAWSTAKGTLRQMQADSAAATRPYVAVRVVPGLGAEESYDVIVQNHGRSLARAVKMNFLTELHNDPDDVLVASLSKRFGEPFDLAPGEQLRFVWAVDLKATRARKPEVQITIGPDDAPTNRGHLGPAQRTDVTLTYQDDASVAYETAATLRWDLLGASAVSQPGFADFGAAGPTRKHFYKLGQEMVAAVNHLRRGRE